MSNLTRVSPVSQLLLFKKKCRRKTGAILVSRVQTGALKRRPKISTREPRDNKDSCSPRDNKKTGVTEEFIPINGAMMKSLEEKVRRPLMTNLFMKEQPRLNGKLMELNQQSMTGKKLTLLLRRKIGAIPELREPTGALKRRPRISTRGPRDNRDSCSPRDNKRTGAIEEFIPINGAMMKSLEEKVRRPLMTNLFMKEQPRLNGNSMDLNQQSMTGRKHIPSLRKLHTLLLTEKTGATLALRELDGVPLRKPLT